MNTRADFLKQAERRYPEFLRSLVSGEAFFPMNLILGKGGRAEAYDKRREELVRLRKDADILGFEVAWETVDERRFGQHERPTRARFTNERRYLQAIGKSLEAARFRDECARILEWHPEWKPWVASNVRVVLREIGSWERILGVTAWLKANPNSGLYPRQLPIFGVDTKFVESRVSLLDELLSFPFKPPSGVDFRCKWGLRNEEPLVRLRFLDPEIRRRCGFPECADEIALPVTQAGRLSLEGTVVIMVENLRNFLALPQIKGFVALFGSGDALANWRGVEWLQSTECHYWGDMDAHGFAMLARLRGFLPHAHSLLMDRITLELHRVLAVTDETRNPAFDTSRLCPSETDVFTSLSEERIRLEQERLPMDYVCREIVRICAATVTQSGGDRDTIVMEALGF